MTNANVGTQGLTWALLGSEAIAVLYDLRWMLMPWKRLDWKWR